MSVHYESDRVTVHHGDCLDVLRELPDASVDAVVTDPPYLLGFMGREWDTKAAHEHTEWHQAWAAECLRVLKPGGHMLAFGGTRTWHRLACAIEDAGFEIRDNLAWMYGSGFPKSLDVSKAIDKAAGAEREVERISYSSNAVMRHGGDNTRPWMEKASALGYHERSGATPATPDAARWQGWGTALKPAYEPIVLARKPLSGTVAANVLAWGTGALNVDGCRVGVWTEADRRNMSVSSRGDAPAGWGFLGSDDPLTPNPSGRWPANVVLDEAAAAMLDEQSGTSQSRTGKRNAPKEPGTYGAFSGDEPDRMGHADSGGASRFFYVARKGETACSDESTDTTGPTTPRPPVAGDSAGAAPAALRTSTDATSRLFYTAKAGSDERPRDGTTAHPTVKPLDLMRWLVRLVTPPGGTVLEPFAGSGTTVEACLLEGFRCVAVEREADYLPLILQRVHRQTDPVAHHELTKGGDDEPSLFDLLGGDAA